MSAQSLASVGVEYLVVVPQTPWQMLFDEFLGTINK